jgi:hypothetical protein
VASDLTVMGFRLDQSMGRDAPCLSDGQARALDFLSGRAAASLKWRHIDIRKRILDQKINWSASIVSRCLLRFFYRDKIAAQVAAVRPSVHCLLGRLGILVQAWFRQGLPLANASALYDRNDTTGRGSAGPGRNEA